MRDGLRGRSYLEGSDCLGTVSLVKVGGLCEFRMTGGFVLGAEKRKGSGRTTGILSLRSAVSYPIYIEIDVSIHFCEQIQVG